jgi:hypothetical protein
MDMGLEANATAGESRMTPAAKEGLPAVVGELVAEMRDVRHTDCENYIYSQIQRWADRLSALTAEAGKGDADELVKELREAAEVEDATGGWDQTAIMLRKAADYIEATPALSTATPAGECAACNGAGEVETLTAHTSGDPQDAYVAPATCPVCDGNGGADPWMPVSSVLPMAPGWYIGINYGAVEPLRWDGNSWHHSRVTRDLAMPSHWRTFDSITRPLAASTRGASGEG